MRILEPDLDGDDVKQWQQFLIQQGFLEAGSAIGHFGPKTEQATKDFQTKHGLEVDGLVGPKTLAQAQTLNFVPPPEPASVLGASSETILQSVHPELARLIRALAEQVTSQMQCVVASGYRTFEEQDKLYAVGRTTELQRAHVTNARAGQSYHNYGLAVDVQTLKGGAINWNDTEEAKVRGPLGHQLGLEWGGSWTDFPDLPHFQLTMGLSLAQCRALHDQAGNDAVWAEVTHRLGTRGLVPEDQLQGEHSE